MGLDAKHNYRFVYLRSEKWDSVRLEALVKAGAKCCICDFESIHNDAHHIHYPSSFWDTSVDDLVILCRPCHNLVHELSNLSLLKFSGSRMLSIGRLKQICAAIRKWKLECNWMLDKNEASAIKDSAHEAEKRLSRPPSCFTCESRSKSVSIRRFSFCKIKPEDMRSPFCDDCYNYIEQTLPGLGMDVGSAAKIYTALRILTKRGTLVFGGSTTAQVSY